MYDDPDELLRLVEKAEERYDWEGSGYWERAVEFLNDLVERPDQVLTLKQKNWRSQLRATLAEPWE